MIIEPSYNELSFQYQVTCPIMRDTEQQEMVCYKFDTCDE